MKWNCFLLAALCAAAPSPKTDPPLPPPVEAATAARVVQVGEHDVVPVNTRLRFTTVIVLPKEEEILDFVCGDKEFWKAEGTQNIAFVKPAKAGSQTNLNLITAAGNVYSFTLSESSDKPHDIKLFIEPKDGALLGSLKVGPRFVAASAIDDYRAQAEIANASLKRVRAEAEERIATAQADAATSSERYKAQLPGSLHFDYDYADQPEFKVAAIFHDGKFTYIRAAPQETPALYELQDDKPSLIQFRFHDGLYTADKIINRGYLAIGKKKLHFTRGARP